MNEVSIIEELLKCLQQVSLLSHLKIQTQILTMAMVHSNLLLIAYCLNAIMIKRGCYLVAFLFAESIVMTKAFNSTGMVNYWLQLAVVACFIYFVGKRINFNLKALFCYAIISLFMLIMAYDAFQYPKTQTFIYANYGNIIMGFHLAIIASTINTKKLRSIYRRFFASLGSIWRNSYTSRYICYNLEQISLTKTKRCQ